MVFLACHDDGRAAAVWTTSIEGAARGADAGRWPVRLADSRALRRRSRPTPRRVMGPLAHEDRHLQRQRHHGPPAAPARMAGRAEPDVACLQELKASDETFPATRSARRRLQRRLARPEGLERRRHPGARRDPVESRRGLPGDPDDTHSRYLEAASTAWSSARSTCPTATRSPDPSSTTSWPGSSASPRTPQSLFDSGQPVVLAGDYNVVPTDFATSTPRARAERRAAAARNAQRLPRAARRRAGPTRSRTCIRTSRSTPSGTTSASAGRATPACASTTCC